MAFLVTFVFKDDGSADVMVATPTHAYVHVASVGKNAAADESDLTRGLLGPGMLDRPLLSHDAPGAMLSALAGAEAHGWLASGATMPLLNKDKSDPAPSGETSPDTAERNPAGHDSPPDIVRSPLPARITTMLKSILEGARFVPSRDRAFVFGSVAAGTPDPRDLDVYLDFRDMQAGDLFRLQSVFGPWLHLARVCYGWLDVFVDTANGLYVRDDKATGWVSARNVRAIRTAGRKGRPLAAFGPFSTHDMPSDAERVKPDETPPDETPPDTQETIMADRHQVTIQIAGELTREALPVLARAVVADRAGYEEEHVFANGWEVESYIHDTLDNGTVLILKAPETAHEVEQVCVRFGLSFCKDSTSGSGTLFLPDEPMLEYTCDVFGEPVLGLNAIEVLLEKGRLQDRLAKFRLVCDFPNDRFLTLAS
jgi:hypothetical protein